ncbi:hypothetical protein L0N33_25905, partial [Roseburia faecis]|nr:hypothetical protein [Roseburia faecis]
LLTNDLVKSLGPPNSVKRLIAHLDCFLSGKNPYYRYYTSKIVAIRLKKYFVHKKSRAKRSTQRLIFIKKH